VKPDHEVWQSGYGVIRHSAETIAQAQTLIERARQSGDDKRATEISQLFAAADRLASAAMWTVAHMTYAARVDLSGADLPASAFKDQPEGHMGGSLNMAIAYVGYLTANALSGHTRAWTLGQGHCVAAIEAVNALTGDVSPAQVARYDRTEAGLSQLASDFYSYAITADGRPAVPLGSHVGAHTAGGVSEGGYLGFAEVQYVHMPLTGERLVAFLSDGAFEEQRGSDWSPRWWRAEDCGLVVPVMVLNGRRIEQRTEIGQEGGAEWLVGHLRLSGFDPIVIDGHDPVAYALAILEAEDRLVKFAEAQRPYPASMPYVIARCIKGFGFPGAGTTRAHNLPIAENPRRNEAARREFNEGARALFVPPDQLELAVQALSVHENQQRPRESLNALATRAVASPTLPEPVWSKANGSDPRSPMDAIDEHFVAIIEANPRLRPRVANPDELKSNHMGRTLQLLRHRVNNPEPGAPEAVDGKVITALNEEAVIGAALGNKGGLNLAVSYEAFAMKMLGALRQDIIFSRRQREIGRAPGWISVPLIATSHTWENSKNEQSHQDPTLPEALLGEMSDTARVLFPIDANSAVAALRAVYRTKGKIACLVTPKRIVPHVLSAEAAEQSLSQGAVHVVGEVKEADVQIVAIGAYQTQEALAAFRRLEERGCRACVTVIMEPGRFRQPRDELERRFVASDDVLEGVFPSSMPRVIVSHTRPEPMLGVLRRLDGGPSRTRALGFLNRGGTLDVFGMLFANRSTAGHVVDAAAAVMKTSRADFLSQDEIRAIDELGDPYLLKRA
jgi:phosphoketolase